MGKFKVGDKVRLTADNCGGSFGSKGDEGVVGDVDGNSIQVNFTTGTEAGDFWFVSSDQLELVTTLTIEAGKFYKTRDGRKVGPISRDSQGRRGHWYWQAPYLEGYSANWCENGSFYKSGENRNDIIAEWVDEPAAQPTKASNDNAEPSKPKFKVGDRVCALVSWGDIEEGKIYTVPHIDEDGEVWLTPNDDGGWNDYLTDNELELVTDAPAIVCLIENGQPKPAIYPHVHADEGAASKEAARLASVHKGQKFGVYVLTQTVSEEKVYAHEWQNLAANGNNIGAIKALREFASLDLLSAKKAVEVFADKAA